MIILTTAQANSVRGLTVECHAIAPVPFVGIGPVAITNGKFGLPESVISDPFHASKSALLASFPTIPDANVGAFSLDPTVTAANVFNPATWLPGQLVTAPNATTST